MEELISIVIPVYNVENYLNKCIKTIVNQTYKNLEIILVDDGSTDKSGKICDEWKEKDTRIKVIHKKNGGLSDARNVGIRSSVGKYLFFIDSDDYVSLDIIENLYKSMKENNVQIVTDTYVLETYYKKLVTHRKSENIVDSEKALKNIFMQKDSVAVWGRLYLRELFNDIEFPVGKKYEDLGTIYKIIDKAENVSYINRSGYHYVQRSESICNNRFTKEDYLTIIDFLETILKFIEEKYPRIIREAQNFYIHYINMCTILLYRNNLQEEYKNLKHKLKQYLPQLLKSPKIKIKTKIMSILNVYFGFSRFYKE